MKALIKDQVATNQKINLLAPTASSPFTFSEPAKAIIAEIRRREWSKEKEDDYLHYTTETVLSSFYRINQYYHFDDAAQTELLIIYRQLLETIKYGQTNSIDLHILAKAHYLRLQQWLATHYPLAVKIYSNCPPILEQAVVCAEYSAKTQMMVLGIDEQQLKGPILDIGCGKEQHLLRYLQQMGFSAFGVDREATPSANVYKGSWLEYDYARQAWGTIISHLGFSNHFRHHHLLGSKWHLQYAAIYMQILRSLQKGGSFFYAPDLPFIESFLNPEEFSITTKTITGTPYKSSIVTKNK